MDESRGTIKTSYLLRVAYMELQRGTLKENSSDFVNYCQRAFDMDGFTAQLFFEVINLVGDEGVMPDSRHPIVQRPGDPDT